MKIITRLKTAVLLPMFLFLAFAANAQFTIVHVTSDSIVPKMASYQYAMSELQAYTQNLQKQFEGKEAEMEAYYMDILGKKKRELLTPKEEKDAQAKLQEMDANLKKFAQDMEAQLYQKENILMTPVYDEYNAAVKAVCQENKYAYVLDKKMILYSDAGIDITQKVLAKLKIN